VPIPGVESLPLNCTSPVGQREGDRILRIAGEPIRDLSDVRLAMIDRGQGETVRLELARADPRSAPRRVSAVVRLL
jgi:C-terminal processing protease CtpA/Prc